VRILRGLGVWGAAGRCGQGKAQVNSSAIIHESNRKSREIWGIG